MTRLSPPAPVALPGSTEHACGCVTTWHVAPVRGRRRSVAVRTVSGSCTARRADWTGTDYRRHADSLGVAR